MGALEDFVQNVYLTRFNRRLDDITDEDGVEEVAKTILWTNMFLDELESEADWNYVRTNDENLGTVASASQVIEVDEDIRKLVTDSERPLILMQGDSIITRFEVVDANQITRRLGGSLADRVALVAGKLVFSRTFKDYEIGASIIADTVHYIPRLAETDTEVLDLVKPYNLLVLGVAKNATLPDIVQGGLSPAFVQKYGDELQKAVALNAASSIADQVVRDDYSYIRGVF